jgi:hypothetical protein
MRKEKREGGRENKRMCVYERERERERERENSHNENPGFR